MPLTWRLGMVAIVAAAVVSGLMPHAVFSSTSSVAREMVSVAESPVSEPVACTDATCDKGSPAPTAPSPGVAIAAVLGAVVIVAATRASIRRRRKHMVALPAGARDPLFHPPQFS